MKKIFKNKRIKILSLSTLSFGLLIPILATTAVACANTNPGDKPIPGDSNKQTLNANDLGLTGTAFANLDTIINNNDNFVLII